MNIGTEYETADGAVTRLATDEYRNGIRVLLMPVTRLATDEYRKGIRVLLLALLTRQGP